MSEPLPYLERIREYYLALGYGKPYEWAKFSEVPFTVLNKPMDKLKLAIITTAAPFQPDKGDQGPRAAYNGAAKFFKVYAKNIAPEPDLRISHIAIDRVHTSAEDQNSYFPLNALKKLETSGKIGKLNHRFFGLPTNRSQKTTTEIDAKEIVKLCKEDQVDAVILVPNCPVCHQSTAITANLLEQSGIATVIMGCARDIIEYIGAPRFLFNDFPLGNSAGIPFDTNSQLKIAELAIELLYEAEAPRTITKSPFKWPGPANWKQDYSNHKLLSDAEIEARRQEFDRAKIAAKKNK